MSTLLLAPTETRPISPAAISEDTSLAELNRIKQSWIQAARDLGYQENIWQVVYWLGSKVRTSGLRECQVWQRGDVAIIANETPLRFIPDLNTNMIRRSFGVWLADEQIHPSRAKPGEGCRGNIVDDILFGSNLVAHWVWLVAGKEIEHARTGDHVDPSQRAERGRGCAFHSCLCVHPLRFSRHHVAVRRESKMLSDLGTAEIQHDRFNRAHWSAGARHVENSRRASPNDR